VERVNVSSPLGVRLRTPKSAVAIIVADIRDALRYGAIRVADARVESSD